MALSNTGTAAARGSSLFLPIRRFEASSPDPFQNRTVLIARLVAMPPLPAVVRSQVIADISALSVGRVGLISIRLLVGSVISTTCMAYL